MAKKRVKLEHVVTLLRQIEVAVANGTTTRASVQRRGGHGADLLPGAEGVRGVEAGTLPLQDAS